MSEKWGSEFILYYKAKKEMSYIKFYDNGTSIKIGVPAENKSMLSFESKFDIEEQTIVPVQISKKEVEELIDFLKRKLEEME